MRQKKSLGQVFLKVDWPCRQMLRLLRKHDIQSVIEIGPGLGVLTRVLIEAGIDVCAVEKDERFVQPLQEYANSHKFTGSLSVVNEDILAFDFSDWVAKNGGKRLAVCGNIPYNISSPILNRVLPRLDEFAIVLLMVQWEFGERVASVPSKKSYGSLSIYAQLRALVHLEYKVERACFSPIPKVDSAVISLQPLEEKESASRLSQIEGLTRAAFSQRRKRLSNSLKPLIDGFSCEDLPIDLSRRCETLSPREFVLLAKALKPELD